MIVAIIIIGQLAEQPQPLTVSHTQSVPPQGRRTLTLILDSLLRRDMASELS